MARRLFVVFNPTAGRNRRARLQAVLDAVAAMGGSSEVCETVSTADAANAIRAAAKSGKYDAIVAAGGDGTVRLTATATLNTGVPVGYIPLGTGNVLAHELDLDRSESALARVLCAGRVTEIELASANNAPFLLMAGLGFDGRVIGALSSKVKGNVGKAAFAVPTLRALAAPLDRMTVTIDGARHHANWVVISNARHYGGHFVLAPGTHISAPGLVAVLVSAPNRATLVTRLAQLGMGNFGAAAARPGSGVTMIPCRHALVETFRPVPLQIDGDAAGSATRLDVKAALATIPLITGDIHGAR